MNLLHPEDRAYILEQLKLAPDSVLADAMLAFNAIRDKVVIVRKMVERPSTPVEEANPVPAETVQKPNVSPGRPSIVKIGAETKATLLKELANGRQPPAKFSEHLKLLWERGEVKFDGKEYWV